MRCTWRCINVLHFIKHIFSLCCKQTPEPQKAPYPLGSNKWIGDECWSRMETVPCHVQTQGQQEWMSQGAIVGPATGIGLWTNVFHLLILLSKVTVRVINKYNNNKSSCSELYVHCRVHLTVLALLTPSVIVTLGEEAEQPSFRRPLKQNPIYIDTFCL